MNEITHETCSELLGPYIGGKLDRARRADVEEHLATCDECSQELAGLVALTAPEIEPLNEVERARIVRAVRAEARGAEREPISIRWGRRFAPALGAAAVLAVIAVGVITLNDEDRSVSPGGGVDVTESDGGGELFDAGEGTGGGEAARPKAAEARGGDTVTNDDAGQPESESIEAGVSQDATLAASAPMVMVQEAFASARFDPSVLLAPVPAGGSPRRAARDLASSAPEAEVGRTIRDCATTTLDNSRRPLAPTYAAYFTRDDIVVIGFVWTDPATGSLNYEVRGWRGPDCDRVSPIYRSGELP
jgi:hypothetical protein